jgi:hypothetical protein
MLNFAITEFYEVRVRHPAEPRSDRSGEGPVLPVRYPDEGALSGLCHSLPRRPQCSSWTNSERTGSCGFSEQGAAVARGLPP